MKKILIFFLAVLGQNLLPAIILVNKIDLTNVSIKLLICFKNEAFEKILKFNEEISFEVIRNYNKIGRKWHVYYNKVEIEMISINTKRVWDLNNYDETRDIDLKRDFFINCFKKLQQGNELLMKVQQNEDFQKDKIFNIVLESGRIKRWPKMALKEQLSELEQAFMSNCVIL